MKSTAVIAEIKNAVPLKGYCLRECMVYEATVSTENNLKLYYGTCEGEFIFFYNHKKPFWDRRNESKLLNYIWQLKDESKNFDIFGKYFFMQRPINMV